MNITHLELRDFRNYPSLSLSFASKLNVIEGANGAGKTNLVEAIYYLSLAKSWRTSEPGALIKSGSGRARILARIEERDLTREIEIVLTPTGRRISVNGKPIHRLSELSRLVNVILFSPEDTAIFKGPPAERRNFLDLNLSKQSLDYFSLIGKYNRLLDERNAALKRNKPDRTYLGVVTDQMIEVSEPLARYRRLYIGELNKILGGLASELYGLDRKAALVYRPFIKDGAFKEEAAKAYAKILENDILHKATSIGIHREDFSLVLDGKDIASYGSQAENRLAAIALKLAPFFLIEDEAKKPIAVLDDVYSELDEAHSRRLSGLIERIGQTFVTAAQISIDGASYIEVSDHKAIRRT